MKPPFQIDRILKVILTRMETIRNRFLSPNHCYPRTVMVPNANMSGTTARECIRGGGSNGIAQFKIVFFFAMVTALVTLATSMFLIILTFYKSERNLKDVRSMMKEHVTTEDGSPSADITDSTEKNMQEEEFHNQESQHNMTKIITSQAFMYLGSFFFTWIFTFLSYCGEAFESSS